MDRFTAARITDLRLYPVKSCAGFSIKEAELWETGLFLDRFWMIVDANDRFVSQRTLPRLALVHTALKFGELRLTAPGMMPLSVPIQGFDYAPHRRRTVTVWRDAVEAFDEDALVHQWISDFIGEPLKMVRIDPDARRIVDRNWTGDIEAVTQFADGFPLLIVSQASLDDLNRRMVEDGREAVTMERFRPNIVVDGLDPYGEDHLATLAGPGYAFRLVKPCTRCQVTSVDPRTGELRGHPIQVLSGYRHTSRADGIAFGMNAVVERGADEAVVKVGDELEAQVAFD